MRVFVVEDSSLLRERLVQKLVEVNGVEVVGYSDTAQEAIDQIRQTKPEAVILDIRLNQSNGFQVLEAIKVRGQLPWVLVLTNFPYAQYRKKFIDSGADYFFDKSNEFDQAIDTIRQLQKSNKKSAH